MQQSQIGIKQEFFMNSAFKPSLFIFVMLLQLLVGSASAQGLGSQDYQAQEARRVGYVDEGTIVNVRNVEITVEASARDRVSGAAVAGVGCALVGRRMSDWTARAALSTLCGLGGERIANSAATHVVQSVELIVKLKDGRLVAVTQQDEGTVFSKGQTVFVIRSGGTDRVVGG